MRGRQTRGIRKPQTPPLALRAQSIGENLHPHTASRTHCILWQAPSPPPLQRPGTKTALRGAWGCMGPRSSQAKSPPEDGERSPGVMKVEDD